MFDLIFILDHDEGNFLVLGPFGLRPQHTVDLHHVVVEAVVVQKGASLGIH